MKEKRKMKKTLTLLFLCGITLIVSAKYRPTCSVQSGDTTKVIFNRITFSIPERAVVFDTLFSIGCNSANGLDVLHFKSGATMVIHYWRPSPASHVLKSNTDQCINDSDCTIIEYDSMPVKDYESRYTYFKSPRYSRKNLTIWDVKFNMIYSIRIQGYENNLAEDPYPKFKEIIKSIVFLEE